MMIIEFFLDNKDFIITTLFICFFVNYLIRVYYHQKEYKLKKDNSKNYSVDKIGLNKYPINRYLFTFVKEKKIKRLYLAQSHVLSDLYKIPQKEFTFGVYSNTPLNKNKLLKQEEIITNINGDDDIDYSSESSISDHEENSNKIKLNNRKHHNKKRNRKMKSKVKTNHIVWINDLKSSNINELKSLKKDSFLKNGNKEDIISVKVIKSNKLLKNIVAFIRREKLNIFKLDKPTEKIQNRLDKGYLFPRITFSKQDNLSNIVEENIIKEINYFVVHQYSKPNEQLNSVINISKAIEFFLVKKVPISLLNIDWSNQRFLLLLERIGGLIKNKNYNILIKIKTFDMAFFSLSLKLKDHMLEIENKKIIKNKLDVLVVTELINYFIKYPLYDVQASIKDPALSIASPYAKLIASSIPKPLHENLSHHITANKHGISYKIIESHPDFEKFLNKNFIHRYLYTYRHTIDIDDSQQPEKIYILYKGQKKDWNEIKDKILFEEDKVTMKGHYSQEGIVDEGVYNWTKLKPFINRPLKKKKSSVIRVSSKISISNKEAKDNLIDEISDPSLSSFESFEDSSRVSEDDTFVNDNEEDDSDGVDEKDMIYESLYNIIDDYNNKYKIFSNIYEEAVNGNTNETAEKFIYYDTHINSNDDPYEHTWGNRYLFEYCSWIIANPRFSGDHAWVRLKTPEGDVYSVGLYRGEKRNLFDQLIFVMKVKPCKYMSPDVSEFWKGYYSTITVEITKEQFEKMKAKIEEDQKLIEYKPYQPVKSNCVTWASDVAAVADIYFPCDLPMIKVIFKNIKLQNMVGKIMNSKLISPYFILIFKILSFFINFITLFAGSALVDKKFKIKRDNNLEQIEPFIKNLKDLADPDKAIIMHPYIIGYFVLNYIKTWRLKQVNKLEKKLNENVGKLKEKKHEYLQYHREIYSKYKDINLNNNNNNNNNNYEKIPFENILNKKQYKTLIKEIKHYKNEINTIQKNIENVKYSIPNKFKKKTVIPKGNLYTNYPLKDDE